MTECLPDRIRAFAKEIILREDSFRIKAERNRVTDDEGSSTS